MHGYFANLEDARHDAMTAFGQHWQQDEQCDDNTPTQLAYDMVAEGWK